MAIHPFLAMTAAEIREFSLFPKKFAWMACHFSPYGSGLSNLPRDVPPGSLLIVDDITPPHGHDPEIIATQLRRCVETTGCCGILFDFQRPNHDETAAFVRSLVHTLPCPAAVSEYYAADMECPVFLPPVPPSVALQDHIASWKSRDIWLDFSLTGETITVTEQGSSVSPLPFPNWEAEGFSEETLHCHYQIQEEDHALRFTFWRTPMDLIDLLEEAEKLGISAAVGLYQELYHCNFLYPDSVQNL